MNEQQLKMILEGALLASGRPLTVDDLQALFDDEERPERDQLRATLNELAQDYNERGVELREVASGFRVQVKRELSPWISRLWQEKPSRYSRALLETMALVAYRQPITRGEIEDIRGVSVSSSIMKTLQEREWIRVVGHRDVPGKPAMYGTTKQFLDYFDLKSLDELPTLAELRDIDSINAELDLRAPGVPLADAAQNAATESEGEDDVQGTDRSAALQNDGDAADGEASQSDVEGAEIDAEAGEVEEARAVADAEDQRDDRPDSSVGVAGSDRDAEAAESTDDAMADRHEAAQETENAQSPLEDEATDEDDEPDGAAQRWRENG